jgi:hypothetical protein
MVFFDKEYSINSPDGKRKSENNLTDINFHSSCNGSILVDHLRVKYDGKLAG